MDKTTRKNCRRVKQEIKMENEKDTNVIYIGNKPFMNYVTAVVMQFTKGVSEVIVKARGKFISRAVDVSEVSTKRFMNNSTRVKDVKIDSAEFENKEGKMVRVSEISITLTKNE